MKVLQTVGVVVTSFGLAVGMTGFASATSGMIENTGYRSHNNIKSSTKQKTMVKNTNNVGVGNSNAQKAESGHAMVKNTTNGGNATTGAAWNENSTSVSGTISNSSASAAPAPAAPTHTEGSIMNTGAKSHNNVNVSQSSSSYVKNTNNVEVVNHSMQKAESGNATIMNTTNGGSATTGEASNRNETTVSLNVSN